MDRTVEAAYATMPAGGGKLTLEEWYEFLTLDKNVKMGLAYTDNCERTPCFGAELFKTAFEPWFGCEVEKAYYDSACGSRRETRVILTINRKAYPEELIRIPHDTDIYTHAMLH